MTTDSETVGGLVPTRAVSHSSLESIVRRWDAIAAERDLEVRTGADISMDRVLVPAVTRAVRGFPSSTVVVDMGCGSGHLTDRLARRFESVVGVDPSARSIALAQTGKTQENARYLIGSAESNSIESRSVGLVVANMVLMDAPELESFLDGVKRILLPGGRLVFTICHPDFWPHYWGYASEDWFSFREEVAIEATFRTTRSVSSFATVHFHRPLSTYTSSLCRRSFLFEQFTELWPSRTTEKLYPAPWRFPRFLACTCVYLPKVKAFQALLK
jgi:SAM-dependent methyltransferase